MAQQTETELRISKRNRTPKNFGPKFHLYLIKGRRDEVSSQHFYCFNVEDDLKTCDEALKSQDVALERSNLDKVDLTKEFFSSKFSIKDMGEADVILVSTPIDTSGKPMPINAQAISQLEHSRKIGCLMYAMTCTRLDIAFAVGKLSRIKRYIDIKPNNELIQYCLQNPPYKFKWSEKTVPVAEGSSETTTEGYTKNYKIVSQDIMNQLDTEAEAVQIILTGIYDDIYSTVDACPNACEMWKAIERLKYDESINVQDLKTNLYWEFEKFTSRMSQELKIVSHHKLYDILKQHQNKVNEIRAERLALQNDNDNYNMFANDREHLEQPKSINGTYLEEQGYTNIIIDSLDMSTNGETVNQDDDDLSKECDLPASLIEKLKCEIDDSKNRNKFLESSNKTLFDKLKGEIKDFKTKNKSLETSNNHFKEANNELLKTNQLMFKHLKRFQVELDRYHNVNYASKIEIDYAKVKGDLMSYKMKS
uniref:Zinc finger, CCHC-type n=1 Tax=Tanacetum cinerariifolium TaxID=118510 RepID=A0A6L2JYF7_TANCI|nr:zinc finger, CCHC-type [Tanacetum cinerariifolium]